MIGASAFVVAIGGCSRHAAESGLTPVSLQTDWYPQPEHGGFYDAVIKGYYKDEGLDVTIVPGGPYVNAEQQVAVGTAQFAMGSSDHLMEGIANSEPIIAVAATMQHDPQGIMVHTQSPVKSFADLDGHSIAIKPGSTWFQYLVKRYQLKNVREVPATYSVANFVQDPDYIQQIFVTSEPFFARKAGADCRTLLISSTGYDPYRVFFTSQGFLQQHPEVVAKFVRASLRGWRDYMNDPTDANSLISKLNPAMNTEQMQFTWQALKDGHFITGNDLSGADVGRLDPKRWSTMYQQLRDLGVIQKPIDLSTAYTLQFLKGN
jgi:NitT/TauT family transport system substrate-binding protein